MAQKSPLGNGLNLPYGDLASEVTRRRFIMTTREEMFTRKCDEAREAVFGVDLDGASPPGTASPPVPPAPPPSPAEDPNVS